MKKIFGITFFLISAACIPALPAVIAEKSDVSAASAKTVPEAEEVPVGSPDENDGFYRVLSCSTGEIIEVSVRDYVIGAVAAEMPASFEAEALKAQAVAAHTYAERQRNLQKKAPDKALGNADFSDDPNKYQGFLTDDKIRRYFGDNYDTYYEKIAAAADEVLPYIITYDDEPIIAAFHSMSSGRTESAENMWGTAVEYLVPVNSESDKEAPNYEDETEVSAAFVRARLEKVFEGVELGDLPEEWIKTEKKSQSGTVIEVTVGNVKASGDEIRQAFGLRSADFTVEYADEAFTFATRGYGHGVGMSQYGANSMAKDGADWREILSHYYKNCEIKALN